MSIQHTLRYLRSGYGHKPADFDIVNELGGRIASTPYEDKAAYIVRCVNSHEALVQALEDAEFLLRKLSINWREAGSMKDSCNRSAEDAHAALNLAKGD